VVTAVPDEKRGERLVVLYTAPEEKLKECLAKLPDSGVPNLWLPKPDAFFKIDTIPYLGTGKLDLQKVRALAQELDHGVRSASARMS
jgi:acyl-[acyl-carrier-protein]-phospholipid O-acyltransferase/long-chain-fatty-acid--[acyl-carrier-protein] ligase